MRKNEKGRIPPTSQAHRRVHNSEAIHAPHLHAAHAADALQSLRLARSVRQCDALHWMPLSQGGPYPAELQNPWPTLLYAHFWQYLPS